MLFNSLEFILVFLPITLVGYFLLGRRGGGRAAISWLVLASLFFYGYWNPGQHALTDPGRWWPLGLIAGSVIFNYLVGRQLLSEPSKVVLGAGVAVNLAGIGSFKYAGFFANDVVRLGVDLHIVLPLAISFFTFQQIAYLVDCYRGNVRAGGVVAYALFVTFFPQLIAGPIVHHGETIPQFARRETYRLRLDNLSLGISIFVIGLAKKVVLADGIAVYATPVFDAALAGASPTLFEAWGGVLAYSFQLYFDFSGYSDMAVGLALMFNIRLPINFNSPYKAVNIVDFWRRWHVTLSRFLRNYLYVALGGNRRGPARRYVNIMIVMLLGGLWHGAGWTFVVWGGLHGLYLLVNHLWRGLRSRLGHDLSRSTLLGRTVAQGLTFIAVTIAWVFFRAESFAAAERILFGMVGMNGVQLPASYAILFGPLAPLLEAQGWIFEDAEGFLFGGVSQVVFLVSLAGIAFLLPNTQEWTGYAAPNAPRPDRAGESGGSLFDRFAAALPRWQPSVVHGSVLGAVLCWCLLRAFAQTPSEFLYFQF